MEAVATPAEVDVVAEAEGGTADAVAVVQAVVAIIPAEAEDQADAVVEDQDPVVVLPEVAQEDDKSINFFISI